MEKNWILVRYGEIGLKSDWVRKEFEDRLMDNIRSGLESKEVEVEIKRGYGRIFVRTGETEKARNVLEGVFGIVSFSPCTKMDADFQGLVEKMADVGEENVEKEDSFAVRARRTGEHSFTSKDLEREAGAKIIDRTGAEVDLDNPEKTVYAEVRQGQAYVFTEKLGGPGGLPLGTQGRVLSLFKGDCESFLATWLLMKRGCSVTLLHGNLEPYRSEEKAEKGAEELEKWSYGSELEIIKFDLGDSIFKFDELEEGVNCILCKRFLVSIADRLAQSKDAKAIVSGETSEESFRNFRLEDSKTELPVLRPLLGLSNGEIRSKCQDVGGDFLLEGEECKASTKSTSKIDEDGIRGMEDEIDFESMVEEKIKDLE